MCQKEVVSIEFTKIYHQKYTNFTPGQDILQCERFSLTGNKKKYKFKKQNHTVLK